MVNIDVIRDDFPVLKEWAYLDNAFVGLMPKQVREGYNEWADMWHNFNVNNATILAEWLEKTTKLRGMVADLVGVTSKEIAFTTCTGSGLNIVINGTDWRKGDNAVFTEWEHNPLDTHTTRRFGVEPREVHSKNRGFELADLEKLIDDNTRLVQVSQVCYTNGFRFNLKEIADISHEHGAKVLVDATQAVGSSTWMKSRSQNSIRIEPDGRTRYGRETILRNLLVKVLLRSLSMALLTSKEYMPL
jgi:selenocysteine lyase/cysteine desulfurase